jgi:Asp-tRNA(Asn)/Glu-tRNA(Gln) amidotransferase A subunit family amidase
MARTVADLKVLFEVMQGPDDGDPSAAPVPVRWPGRDDLKKLRIGYFEDDGRTPVTAETRAALQTAAEALRRAGFEVEQFRPEGLEQARQLWWQFFGIAGGMLLGPMIEGKEANLSPILKQFSSWVAAEPSQTAQTLLDTWILRDVVRMQVFSQMRAYPILLCPVASIPAFHHGERSWEIDVKTVPYLECMELQRVVQSPGKSGGGGSSWAIERRLADRSADRGASMGRGTGACRGSGTGRATRSMAGTRH